MRRAAALSISTLIASTIAAAVALHEPAVLALPPNTGGFALDVNEPGEIVGVLFGNPVVGSFLYSRSGVEPIAFPAAGATFARGLNNRGDIVGSYGDGRQMRGFLRTRKGGFSTVDVPGADGTTPNDVNAKGHVVGQYVDVLPNTDEQIHGFILTARGFQTIDNPLGEFHTFPQSINDAGTIVGYFGGDEDSPKHGFVLRGREWTVVDYPGADSTFLNGIANNGTIVGYAFLPDQVPSERGFAYRDGRFVDLPGVYLPYGVTSSGTTVGVWYPEGGGPLAAWLSLKGKAARPNPEAAAQK